MNSSDVKKAGILINKIGYYERVIKKLTDLKDRKVQVNIRAYSKENEDFSTRPQSIFFDDDDSIIVGVVQNHVQEKLVKFKSELNKMGITL